MNKIPTAEEFLKDVIEVPFRHTKIVEADVAREKLIKFARLHVKAALQSAALKAEAEGPFFPQVDKSSILKSYPETNIK